MLNLFIGVTPLRVITSQLHNTQIKTVLLPFDVLLGNMASWHVPAEQRAIKFAALISQILTRSTGRTSSVPSHKHSVGSGSWELLFQ